MEMISFKYIIIIWNLECLIIFHICMRHYIDMTVYVHRYSSNSLLTFVPLLMVSPTPLLNQLNGRRWCNIVSWSKLVKLMASSHYLPQCWLIINKISRNAFIVYPIVMYWLLTVNKPLKIKIPFPIYQWVDGWQARVSLTTEPTVKQGFHSNLWKLLKLHFTGDIASWKR